MAKLMTITEELLDKIVVEVSTIYYSSDVRVHREMSLKRAEVYEELAEQLLLWARELRRNV